MDSKTGEVNFGRLKKWLIKNTVETEIKELKTGEEHLPFYNPDRHIFIEEAKKSSRKLPLAKNWNFL